jgi:hypothetical protein
MSGERAPLPKVVYIAGWGRSGSTILDLALGGIEGWFSCGELNTVWWNLDCGCGARVHECEFWRPVLDQALSGDPGLDLDALSALQRDHLGTSPMVLAAIHREARRGSPHRSPPRRYAEALTSLYAAIGDRAGARVVVDSTKLATDAYLISALTEIDLYVVHLVRDPRATAYAWTKRKPKSFDPVVNFGRYKPAKNALLWLRRNLVIEALVRRRLRGRYLRLRYEDFAEAPAAAVRSICALVGEPEASLPFASERTVRLLPNHTVGGNPGRFSTGQLEIRPDDEWKSRLGVGSKALATLPAAPLMRRYRYPLLSSKRALTS